MSNWTPLDMASLPRFRFLDITLYPAYWPTFTRKTELTNKNWQRHNQEYQNASLSWCILMHPVAPHCIPGHLEWVSSRSGYPFFSIRTISICFLRRPKLIWIVFPNNFGMFCSQIAQNEWCCLCLNANASNWIIMFLRKCVKGELIELCTFYSLNCIWIECFYLPLQHFSLHANQLHRQQMGLSPSGIEIGATL